MKIHGHLKIEPLGDGFHRLSRPPVRHHHPGKPPFPFEYPILKPVIGGAWKAIETVVGRHHRPDAPFLDSPLKRLKIDLTQRLLIHHGLDLHTPPFLVIPDKMLHRGGHPLTLEPPDPIGGDDACEKGVFSVVFKVPAIERNARDIHSRPQLDMNAASACFTTKGLAVKIRQMRIPGRGKCDATRERAGRTMGTDALRSVGHDQFGDSNSGDADCGHPVKTVTRQ